jgi:riboflavin transporter FmnP
MSNTFVWLVKIACLVGSMLSTWYFLQTMFPPELFSIVPIGWCCFEIGVLLWPKYTFSKDPRTFSQRITGFIMSFVSYTGCVACFVGNIFMVGPDKALFALTSSMKAFIIYGVVADILLTMLVCMLVTSILPYWQMLDISRNQVDFRRNQVEKREINLIPENNQVDSEKYTHNGPAEEDWGGERPGAGRKKKL